MITSLKNGYNNLQSFLSNYNAKHTDNKPTNTSMIGGSYYIPDTDVDEFLKLYYKHVFVNKKDEFLTEKQLDIGAILIDIDLRYNGIVKQHMYTNGHVQDMVYLYLEEIKKMAEFNVDDEFPIYVMEKQNTNPIETSNITKDGIHIYIGVAMDHKYQVVLRTKVLENIDDILCDLELSNSYDKVLDDGISKGTTNWTLYGSKKPNHESYYLTNIFNVKVDKNYEFKISTDDVKQFNLESNFSKLSARYSKWIMPPIRDEYKNIATEVSHKKTKTSHGSSSSCDLFSQISDRESLEKAVESILNCLKPNEYYIRETHEYTQVLPEKYYEPGSHELNRKVAFALKNTDPDQNRLFLSWIMLRSKADDFDYSTISKLYNDWNKYFNVNTTNYKLTRKSIMYWVRTEAFDEYNRIRKHMLDHFVDTSITTDSDFDYAVVLYQLYRDKYICSHIKNNEWYMFENHRWEKDDGNTLRLSISREMHELYQDKLNNQLERISQLSPDDPNYDSAKEQGKHLVRVCKRLKSTASKNNIIIEAKELFIDRKFNKVIDSNKYLLGFTNGVIDFENNEFREGRPGDYITKCTNNPYRSLDEYKKDPESSKIIDRINMLMEQTFPIPAILNYMWDHLSASLIGAKKEQVFNIYKGSGCNGKSILTDFMAHALGDYKGVLPVNFISDRRKQIGSAAPELAQLRGTRYVVMEEPTKGTILNEGVMKDITGGGPMQARGLYQDSVTFTPQFSLAVCTNTLFEVKSNDDGTWRRLKLVEFMSKFVGEKDSEMIEDDTQYRFPKDKDLESKLEGMAPVFVSMLVERAFQTRGVVLDCDEVIEASVNYRRNQDYLSYFVFNLVEQTEVPCPGVGHRELHEFFRMWFDDEHSGKKQPSYNDLDDVMSKKYGIRKTKNTKWKNVRLKYERLENSGKKENELVEYDDDDITVIQDN